MQGVYLIFKVQYFFLNMIILYTVSENNDQSVVIYIYEYAYIHIFHIKNEIYGDLNL